MSVDLKISEEGEYFRTGGGTDISEFPELRKRWPALIKGVDQGSQGQWVSAPGSEELAGPFKSDLNVPFELFCLFLC